LSFIFHWVGLKKLFLDNLNDSKWYNPGAFLLLQTYIFFSFCYWFLIQILKLLLLCKNLNIIRYWLQTTRWVWLRPKYVSFTICLRLPILLCNSQWTTFCHWSAWPKRKRHKLRIIHFFMIWSIVLHNLAEQNRSITIAISIKLCHHINFIKQPSSNHH
jgi:hypothetical protein